MRRALLLASLLPTLVACGPEFEAPSTLRSVRVIGVQKDKPYAQPGDTVNFGMLLHDGAEEQRQVNVQWFAGCVNPPGDIFAGCYPQLAEALSGDSDPDIVVGEGYEFSYTLPSDIISAHGRPPQGKKPYGLAFVFFTACTGTLAPAPGEPFPIQCVDGDDERVGADGFVVGYTQVFAYDAEGYTNTNPTVTGLRIGDAEYRGVEGPIECLGASCVTLSADENGTPPPDRGEEEPPADEDCDTSEPWCIDHCTEDDIDDCPKHALQVLITEEGQSYTRDDAEVDAASSEGGDTVLEQMWVNYYVTSGKLDGDIRILQDATEGPQIGRSDTEFFAPQDKGPFHVWAAAHDNRGGVDWVRARLFAR